MAIIDQGGRFQSIRTQLELNELLAQDMNSMSEDERALVLQIMSDLQVTGKSPLLDTIGKAVYKRQPVSMETFLTDDYYLGKVGRGLFPPLKNDLIEIFSGRYTEAMIGGSIGAGKTTFATVAFLRMIYEVSCLSNPHEAYGIMPGDKIAFIAVSITEDLAQEIVVDGIQKKMRQSPYFMREFKPVKEKTTEILFPNDVWIAPGVSSDRGALGMNCFGAIIDESNFFRKSARIHDGRQNMDHAEEIYLSIKRRMESRFMANGKLPGMIIMISSKKSVNSFSEKRVKEAAGDPNVFVRERAMYEVHPEKRYSGLKFRVAIGNETKMSRILVDGEVDPEAMQVIQVPIEFKEAFEKDIDKAIRDIAGYATVSVTPFITRRDKIGECIDQKRSHPFSEYVWDQTVPLNVKWDQITKKNHEGARVPLLNPSVPRFIHIDFSKGGGVGNDPTGISMGHIGGYTVVKNQGVDEYLPIFNVDFMLRIEPPPSGEVDQAKVRQLIYDFSMNGFYVKKVTCDQFQSLGTLQILKSRGYQTGIVSVDAPGGAYELVKQALYENRTSFYRYEPVIKEFRELIKNWRTGKVDHPETGTKDVADSFAGVIFNLHEASKHFVQTDQPIRESASVMDSDDWVLEGGTVVVRAQDDKGERENWRREADRILSQESENMENNRSDPYSDWRSNFQMPFDAG